MPASPKKPKSTWFTLLILLVALAIWAYDQKNALNSPAAKAAASQTRQPPFQKPSSQKSSPATPKDGRYEVHRNCTLVENRGNDGDSFMVRLPTGKTAQFRLYFVDTPESAFKRYSGGETNHPRIRQQAADLGGITPEQAVEIGKKAKAFTLNLLASQPFTLYTEWDSPFNDGRYHAHVQVLHEGKPTWLHQILIIRGLARIKTKPADLPDGTTAAQEKENLRRLEGQAKRKDLGAWGI